jgi:hypothetical protein
MSYIDPASTPPPVPVAVQPLTYSLPFRQGRPGIITAIGVLCIVIACLSGIFSLSTGIYSFSFYMMSKMMTRMSTMSATLSASPPISSTSSSTNLSPGEVGVAVNTLRSMLALDASHIGELDRLLRLHGRQVFGGDEDVRLTTSAIQEAVTNTTPQPQALLDPAQFSTSEGTVEIFSDHATFTSTDGSTTVNTSAKTDSDQTTPSTPTTGTTGVGTSPKTPPKSGTTLTKAQVNQVVAGVQSTVQATGAPALNPAQSRH